MWVYLVLAIIIFLIYLNLQSQKYWLKRGVKYQKPWPLIGSMAPMIFKRKHVAELLQDFYKAFPNERYMGVFQFFQPTLVLRDPELIKEIFVKNFDSFPEHQTYTPEGVDPIWDKNLFTMKGGQKWHDLRTTLSPSFTSSKMKLMFDLVKDVGKQFINHLQKKNGLIEIDMKDTFSKFTNDVIGTAAFGITCNSFENPDNEFYKMGKKSTDFTGIRSLLFLAYSISPTLMKIFDIRMVQENVKNFFSGVIMETINYRTANNIVRPDMIHLLMEARKNQKPEEEPEVVDSGFSVVQNPQAPLKTQKGRNIEITDLDIVAQAFVFFFAGFDTTSTLLSFAAYELALNPDVQNTLRDEIDETLRSSKKNDFTYESLMGMKYLDMVISEALRKWPPLEGTDRQCKKAFSINPVNGQESTVHLDTSASIWIPIYAIHRDPQYYPEPDRFDPERFSDQNKGNVKPYTYMPFGVGPRTCIGSRFALMEIKLVIALLLSKFELVPIEKTQIPLKLEKGGVNMNTERSVWLGIKPRGN